MSHMDETSCSQLPPEILQTVVSRLPLVSLFRCRVVCKQWNAWISELHPQTPAQKTEIFIVSNYDDQLWFALDTSINKWYDIDCRSLSIEPHIGVGCMVTFAAHKGLVLAGIHVAEKLEAVFVCDPLRRVHYGVIPELGVPPHIYKIMVDDNTKSYKVYLLSVEDEFWPGAYYDRRVDVYNSNDKRWTMVCSIPELSDNYAPVVHKMAISEDFVHLLIIFEPAEQELKIHSILSYNMIEKIWIEHGRSDIPLFLREDIRIGHLLMIRGQMLLVGERLDVSRIRTNILVWELSFGSNEICVEIADMPLSIFGTVKLDELEISGGGDCIFFLSHNSNLVTSYCLLDDSWHYHPDLTAPDTVLPEFVRCALFEKFMTLAVIY